MAHSCPAQTFSGITPARFQCLAAQAATRNIPITGNSGSATAEGITVSWNFDPASQTLTLQCTSAPLLVPCGMVNSRLHDLVANCP
jgi:hypothetical protein